MNSCQKAPWYPVARGGHVHPLNLALGEAAALEALGGTIFEHSPVESIVYGEPAVLKTPSGRVDAGFVVVAGNAYLGQLIPELAEKTLPCGTQMIATEARRSEYELQHHRWMGRRRGLDEQTQELDFRLARRAGDFLAADRPATSAAARHR